MHQLSSRRGFRVQVFLGEIRGYCHFEDIIHSVGVSVSHPKKWSFSVSLGSTRFAVASQRDLTFQKVKLSLWVFLNLNFDQWDHFGM
jgi:hypothetical protein